MTNGSETDEKAAVIVGGGIHGAHIAIRLLEETPLDHGNLLIIDPHDRLLGSFRAKARACGMDVLRSSFVHHLESEPSGLEVYAETNGREDELVPTVDYPPRPTIDLFADHARSVIEAHDLESVHRVATVERVHERHDRPGVRVETSTDTVLTRTCVLAIGHGGRYRRPEWTKHLDNVTHVWGGFDRGRDVGDTIVVGGGITAGHLVRELTETEPVTLLTRHPLEWELSEADPRWINWSHIEARLHTHPVGSKARYETAAAARRSATMPPYFYHEIDSRLAEGQLRIEQGEIIDASTEAGRVALTLEYDDRLVADRVVLASGFQPVFDHPFVGRLRNDLGVDCGFCDMPVLDDRTLAWCRETGETTPVYVSGPLAVGTVGPLAPTIAGARTAAERIIPAIRTQLGQAHFSPPKQHVQRDPADPRRKPGGSTDET